MKACHAVALGLVVWFLMVPRDRPKLTDPVGWTSKTPLRDWEILHRFDAESSCQRRRVEVTSDALHATKTDANANRTAAVLTDFAILNNATCVSRDDPRLKK